MLDGKALDLTCPDRSCDYILVEDDVKKYLNERQFSRFQQFVLVASVKADKKRRLCPTKDCEGILTLPEGILEKSTEMTSLFSTNGKDNNNNKKKITKKKKKEDENSLEFLPIQERGVEVICDQCSKNLCFYCLREWHKERSCRGNEQYLRTKNLLEEEDSLQKWSKENDAKPCPRCHVPITKNGGCNHVCFFYF